MIKTQFTLYMRNRPGELAQAIRGFAKEGVNIEGISVAQTTDLSVVQLVAGNATPQDTPRFGLALAPSDSGEGVAVADVLAGSPAAEQGIERGDVILEIDGSSVNQPEAAAQALRQSVKKGDKAVLLLVKNDRGQRFVALQNPKG